MQREQAPLFSDFSIFRMLVGLVFWWIPLLFLVSRLPQPMPRGMAQWLTILMTVLYEFKLPKPSQRYAPTLFLYLQKPLKTNFTQHTSSFILLITFLLATIRIPPWTWSQPDTFGIGEDWTTYRDTAMHIFHGDLFLLHQGAGFRELTSLLYAGFVGVSYILFNGFDRPIYFIQHLTAAGIFITWFKLLRPLQKRPLKISLLAAAAFLLALDLLHNYSMRLLSENLTLPLLSVLLLLILRDKKLFWQGVLCGLIYLNRLELAGTGLLLLCFYVFEYIVFKKRILKQLLAFAIPFVLIAALYPLRNYVVYDKIRLLPDFSIEDGRVYNQFMVTEKAARSSIHWEVLAQHVLRQLNVFSGEEASWRSGVAWYVIHAMLLLGLFWLMIKKHFAVKHLLALGFIASVTVPYFFGPITYGFRHSLPMAFAEVSLFFFIIASVKDPAI